eukprot:6197594-Pleurochrysis_carterae.AAC.2
MEVPGATTKAARFKSPVSAQLGYIDASFSAGFAMLQCVGQPLALTRWRVAFQMRSPSAWTLASTQPGRGASSFRPS